MLFSSDLAKAGITLIPLMSLGLTNLDFLNFHRPLKCSSNAATPMITHMFTMFEPKTFPTESAAPPDTAAIIATVSSGNEVEKAIRLKPTAVFPSRVMLETFTAFPMARLLAQFKTRKEMAITITFATISVMNISTIFIPLLLARREHKLSQQLHRQFNINIAIRGLLIFCILAGIQSL